jgi:hypothetical protein
MLKKLLLIGLLCIGVLALVVPQAPAKVCVAYYKNKCVLWSGSLECTVGATGLGDCSGDTLSCRASGTEWAVICGNPGTNIWCAPGINIVELGADVTGSYEVTPADCVDNGKAEVTIYAQPSQDLKDQLLAAGACPNQGWSVLDAVPCATILTDQQFDEDGCLVSEADLYCELPDCGTLTYTCDPPSFERRQYDCETIDTRNYPKPLCEICDNTEDDDHDGLVDCDDPSCSGDPVCATP